MGNTAIVLAGGSSRRFGKDKGLTCLGDRPLVKHVLDNIRTLANERILVVSSEAQVQDYKQALGSNISVLTDAQELQAPLMGALTGFQAANEKHSLLLPCDTPFISKEVISLLLDLCISRTAVIPRWPSGYAEPLQAVYCTKHALEAARNALARGEANMQAMINRLGGVRYVSTLVIRQLDPQLRTFFNINTPLDLRRAEAMLAGGQ